MKLFSFFTPLFLVAAAGLGFANQLPVVAPKLPAKLPTADPITLISELSPQCQAALFSIVTSPEFFQCVPVASLLPLLTDPTLLPSVLSDPVANAPKLLPIIQAICADPKCSDEGVAAATKAVNDGCSADLDNPIIELVLGVLTFYSPVRDIICFENNKEELCIVETFTTIFTLPPPPPDFTLFNALGPVLSSVIVAEPKFICTACNKAILNTAVNFLKKNPQALAILEQAFKIGEEELILGKIFVFLKCGFEFLDGKVPDPSKINPGKFTYQKADTSPANQNEMNLFMIGSLLASSIILN
jgi:hypothetical protein